jgi:hypothetical protein
MRLMSAVAMVIIVLNPFLLISNCRIDFQKHLHARRFSTSDMLVEVEHM